MSLRDLVSDDSCTAPGIPSADSHSMARNPLGQFFQQFVHSSRTQQQINEVHLPSANFTPIQQEKIRTRANVMARQFFPDQPEEFVTRQIDTVLRAVNVQPQTHDLLPRDDLTSFLPQGALTDAPPTDESWEDYMGRDQLDGGAAMKSYVFASENPFTDHAQPMRAGIEAFSSGDLNQAVLAFEAEVQRDPSNSDAWRYLGAAHAESDDDQRAIGPLLRSVEADPSNLDALLDLGVSYTNELAQRQALNYLKQWMQFHPQYSQIQLDVASEEMLARTATLHGEVTELFLEAGRMAPDDPDVHTVLGVLFNLSRDYDQAISHFQTAVQLNPDSYSLWNKLGATQANSFHSKEAVQAYTKALDLRPRYVRAFVNLGISYANQAMYDEAARHYLKALTMNPRVEHIWSYLRMTFSCMERGDLDALAAEHNLDALVREFPL